MPEEAPQTKEAATELYKGRFFVQKDIKTEIVRGYDLLVETPERPFNPMHFNLYLMNASPENYFTS